MVSYVENRLGSSLHNNGHAEEQIKRQLSINGVCPEPMEAAIHWQHIAKVRLSVCQQCQQWHPTSLQKGPNWGSYDKKGSYQPEATSSKTRIYQPWPFTWVSQPRSSKGEVAWQTTKWLWRNYRQTPVDLWFWLELKISSVSELSKGDTSHKAEGVKPCIEY